jgi:MFS family permease
VLLAATTCEQLGSAATWSGLPIYVARFTGDARQVGGLFLVESIAGILMMFGSGYLADAFSKKRVVCGAALASAASLFILFCFLRPGRIWLFYVVGIAVAMSSSVASSSLQVWVASLVPKGTLVAWTGRRGIFLSSAKLGGTFIGPLIFGWLGRGALVLDIATLITACCLYGVAVDINLRSADSNLHSGLRGVMRSIGEGVAIASGDPTLRRLLLLTAVGGLIGMPITAAALTLLIGHFHATDASISGFWLVGFFASVGANSLLGLGIISRLNARPILLCGYLFLGFGICLAAASTQSSLFIAIFPLIVVPRVMMNVTIFGRLFEHSSDSVKGRIIALSDLMLDSGTLLGLLIWNSASSFETPLHFALYAAPIITAAILIAATWKDASQAMETSS